MRSTCDAGFSEALSSRNLLIAVIDFKVMCVDSDVEKVL